MDQTLSTTDTWTVIDDRDEAAALWVPQMSHDPSPYCWQVRVRESLASGYYQLAAKMAQQSDDPAAPSSYGQFVGTADEVDRFMTMHRWD